MLVEIIIALMVLSLVVFAVPASVRWLFSVVLIVVGAVISGVEAIGVLSDGAVLRYEGMQNIVFGSMSASVDSLSALFIIISSLAAVSVAIYSRGYIKAYIGSKPKIHFALHYFCMMVLYYSVLLVFIFRDGFGFLFSWELMSICSCMLILLSGERANVRRAALNYLIMMHVGFAFLLIGFVTLAVNGLPVSFDSLGVYFAQQPVMPLFVIFLIGFGMKAGIFPLHVWLPEADPAAPAHVSAFMSGVMTKMGIYGVIRVVSAIEIDLWSVAMVLLVVGVITGVWGVILCVVQNEMRKMLAYSTIENIGIIFIALGIGFLGKAQGDSLLMLLGVGGALLHVTSHCFMKLLLFMGVGNIQSAAGTTMIDSLGGLGRRMPATSIIFLVAVLAICAMPPFCGFVSEFMIYLGMFEAVDLQGAVSVTAIIGMLFMALIGGITLLAFCKLYGVVFLGSSRQIDLTKIKEVSSGMLSAMAVPLAMVVMIGALPFLFIRLFFRLAADATGFEGGDEIYSMLSHDFVSFTFALFFMIALCIVLWIVRRRVMRKRREEEGPTWSCGFTAPTSKMQYSGESFSDSLMRISGRVYKNTGDGAHLAKDEIFPVSHNFEVGHRDKMDYIVTKWWFELLHIVNERFSRIRSGKVNHYILYALLFFALIFVLSMFKII